MAVGVLRDFTGVSTELYDAIVQAMNFDTEPVAGLIFHVAGPGADGVWREFNVWESREAFEEFQAERAVPALIAVLGEEALRNGPPPPEPRYMEVHDRLP